MSWMEANGVELHYVLEGPKAKKPLILIHELGGGVASWDRAMPLMQTRRTLRWDWRGAGQSEKVRGELSVSDLVADLSALLDGLGISETVDIAGTALGGGVALAFAAREPLRVNRLVVSSPAIGGDSGIEDMLRSRADDVEKVGMRAQVDISLDRSYLPKYRDDDIAFQNYRSRWIANDPGSYASHNRMLASMDERKNLSKIAAPTLIIGGTDDSLLPPKDMATIASHIQGAEFVELPTGHFAAVNTPELWANEALGFFGEG